MRPVACAQEMWGRIRMWVRVAVMSSVRSSRGETATDALRLTLVYGCPGAPVTARWSARC